MKPGSVGDVGDALLRVPLLESLYRDQIPPTASNLRCRWQEIVTEYEKISGKCPFSKKITVQDLLKMYAGHTDTLVIVDHEVDGAMISSCDGKRTTVLKHLTAKPGKAVSPELARREASAGMKLRNEPEVFFAGFRIAPRWFQGFVDPLGPDVYPEEMWSQLADYMHQLMSDSDSENCWFQGGRYGAAKDLRRRQLPFFEGRSLGELSHIVQLALTNEHDCRPGRSLLSYQPDKTIAPRALSQRQLLADLGLPVGQSLERRVGQGCVTDEERWSELCQVLQVVLADHPQGRSLALLKVDIERRFGMILDQSVFREVKLSRLFESPKLRDLFEVRRGPSQAGSSSQVIVRLKESALTTVPQASTLGLQASQGPVTVPPPAALPATQLSMRRPPGNLQATALPGASPPVLRSMMPANAPTKTVGPPRVIPPPGLLGNVTEDDAPEDQDCCPPGFALAQGFSNCSPEDLPADAGQDFFGPGLQFAEDLLKEEPMCMDKIFTTPAAKAQHATQIKMKADFPMHNSLWGGIWGTDSLLGIPMDVHVTA